MSARRILQLGDPVLRDISCPVSSISEAAPIIAELRDTLHEFQRTHGFGRGISAVQIGVPQRIIYLEFERVPYCLVNPAYIQKSEETFRLWDDCFSFPNLLVYLERSTTVSIRYSDESGVLQTLEASGSLSELIQHEMDHLDGILAIDRALDKNGFCTREEWLRRYRRSAANC